MEVLASASTSSRPIDLLVGPYRCGKTTRLLEELLRFSQESPFEGALVVVPSARYRNLLEERLLALSQESVSKGEREQAGYIGLRIMPFYELCRSAIRSAGIACHVLPDNVRQLLLSRLIEDLNDGTRISALSPIAHYRGTWSAVLDLIDEFQRAALSPQEVLAQLEKTASADCRLVELARVYECYWQELSRLDCQDQHLLAFKARELFFAGAPVDLNAGWVAADGFDRFNRLQLEVLLGLSRHVSRTTITFDYVVRSSRHYPRYQQEYLWKEESFQQLLAVLRPSIAYCEGHAQEREMQVSSYLDRYMEMVEIARSCKQLICERATPPRNILVVARDLSSYHGAVQAAFDSAGLPYFVDESVACGEQPIVQFVGALLRLWIDDFARAQVVSCLKSRYLNLRALGLAPADVDTLDERSLKVRLAGAKERWEASVLKCLGERIGRAVAGFFQAVTPQPEPRTQTEFCLWVENLLDKLLVSRPRPGADDDHVPDADAHRGLAAVRSVIASLIEEETVLGKRPDSYANFLGRFETLIEQSNFRRSPQFQEAITICGADVAPNRSFDDVFIAGLLEGEFPRRASSSGFVSAEELARWSGFGVVMHNPRHHPGFESALYSSLLERARLRAHLSFPRYEMSTGEEMVPSFLITRGDADIERSIPFLPPFAESAARPISARDAFAGWLWAAPDFTGTQAPGEHSLIDELGSSIAGPLAVARSRSFQQRESVYNGYLADLVGSGALAVPVPGRWSASALNMYGACPFRYWVSRVLGWESRQEPESGIPVTLLGDTYHKALELFYAELVRRQLAVRTASAQVWQSIFEDSLAGALKWLESRDDFQPGSFWEYDRLEIRFRLERFLKRERERFMKDDEPFEPATVEAGFGIDGDGSPPPLKIDFDGKQIELRGFIDRIDLVAGSGCRASRARVVDYKSGYARYSRDDALAGRSLQIPIYALAVQTSVIPGSTVVEGVYLSVGSGEQVGAFDLAGGEAGEFLAGCRRTIARLVGGVERGDFTVRPSTPDVCKHCPHGTICRISELAHQDEDDERSD